jgi:exonuclease VII large subunit
MGFPQSLWVCGEIQGFDRNKSKKHIFFDLCEKDPDSKSIVARIGLVIFDRRKNHLNEILTASENAFKLKDDIEVKFLCKVDFYPPHGAMRLIVESIDPVYTLGKIAQ